MREIDRQIQKKGGARTQVDPAIRGEVGGLRDVEAVVEALICTTWSKGGEGVSVDTRKERLHVFDSMS